MKDRNDRNSKINYLIISQGEKSLKIMRKVMGKATWSLSVTFLILLIGCNKKGDNGSPTQPKMEPEAGTYYVDIYDSAQTCQGTTLFTDGHDVDNMRVVEVDMDGSIVWEFTVPPNWVKGNLVGFDVELLGNGNILIVLSKSGLYEIDRSGNAVWQHLDPDCSHDADRLSNGNTIYVFGDYDIKGDMCVKEVDTQGNLVWSWKPLDHYNSLPYNEVDYQGWVHNNAVTRLENGNTMISPRNFDMTIIVDSLGKPVWEYQWQDLYTNATTFPAFYPHEPEINPDGTLIVCLQNESPYEVVEINQNTGMPVWEYHRDNFRTCRDADRLPNGNVLVVGVMTDTNESVIFEVTPGKEIVWQLRLYQIPVNKRPGHFFKAQRIIQ